MSGFDREEMDLRWGDDNAASKQWIYALSTCNRETARCPERCVMDGGDSVVAG
jgi:hypothetical protein